MNKPKISNKLTIAYGCRLCRIIWECLRFLQHKSEILSWNLRIKLDANLNKVVHLAIMLLCYHKIKDNIIYLETTGSFICYYFDIFKYFIEIAPFS